LVSLGECILINLEELQTMKKHENEALKDIITKKDIRIRRPYARNNETMPRRASFMGTGNASQFLTDPSGSRRFLSFTVTDNIDNEHKIDINKVYAQAYALSKQGYKYWFDRDEIDEIESQNEQFQIKSIEEELLLKYFEPVTKDDAFSFHTTTEILAKMHVQTSFNFNEGSLMRLGRALKKNGFERTKKKSLYVWAVKEVFTN
jgi:predicted P-loop ATPase